MPEQPEGYFAPGYLPPGYEGDGGGTNDGSTIPGGPGGSGFPPGYLPPGYLPHGYSGADGSAETGSGIDWDLSFGPAYTNISGQIAALDADSTEYVHARVAARDAGTGMPLDPTAAAVALAVTADDPGDGDWLAADWLSRTDGTTWARALVRAGSLAGPALIVWVRVAAGDETTVGQAGLLQIQ